MQLEDKDVEWESPFKEIEERINEEAIDAAVEILEKIPENIISWDSEKVGLSLRYLVLSDDGVFVRSSDILIPLPGGKFEGGEFFLLCKGGKHHPKKTPLSTKHF